MTHPNTIKQYCAEHGGPTGLETDDPVAYWAAVASFLFGELEKLTLYCPHDEDVNLPCVECDLEKIKNQTTEIS